MKIILALLLFGLSCQAQYGGFRRVKFSIRVDQIARYEFDESSGTTVADSAGENDGTAQNGMARTTAAAIGANAGVFDGSNDYVELDDPAEFYSTTFSVSVWAKATLLDNNVVAVIVSDLNAAGNRMQYTLGMNRSAEAVVGNTMYFQSLDNSGNLYTAQNANAAITDEVWEHWVGVYDGADLKLYKNAVEVASLTSTFTPSTQGVKYRIGIQGELSAIRPWSGAIDDLRLHSRPLTSPERYELSIRE